MSAMRIVPYTRRYANDLQGLINHEIALMPPYWQLSAAQVAAILEQDTLWDVHFRDEPPQPWRWAHSVVCAVDAQERVVGAMRLDQRYDNSELAMTAGRWLVSEAGHAAGAAALLDYLAASAGRHAAEIIVDGRHDFGIGWSGVPTTNTTVAATLRAKGFAPWQQWLVMTADISRWADRGTPAAPAGYEARWRLDAAHDERDIQLYADGVMVGECQAWGIPKVFADCADYGAWMQIEWLGVEAAHQRRGLGRWMLEAQLRRHAAAGVRYCLLYTEVDNRAAQAVNAALGFVVKAEVWGWRWRR